LAGGIIPDIFTLLLRWEKFLVRPDLQMKGVRGPLAASAVILQKNNIDSGGCDADIKNEYDSHKDIRGDLRLRFLWIGIAPPREPQQEARPEVSLRATGVPLRPAKPGHVRKTPPPLDGGRRHGRRLLGLPGPHGFPCALHPGLPHGKKGRLGDRKPGFEDGRGRSASGGPA